MRHIDDSERRARLGVRHSLARPVSDPVAATRSVYVLHSSDPVTVFLSTWARTEGFQPSHLETALYHDKTLVRMHGMRRTLWVMPVEDVAVVHGSSTRTIGIRERKRSARLLEEGGITDDGMAWLENTMPMVVEHISEKGEVLTRDLTDALPVLDGKLIFYNRQGRLMGTSGVASRVLLQLSIESKVVRTRPAGTWVSGQYRWAETVSWLGSEIADIPEDGASPQLLRGWLERFGPATEEDIRWWTGWPLRQVRHALDDVAAVEVALDGDTTGFVLPDDLEPADTPERWVAMLPSLDPTTMGWKKRDWYLGEHGSRLFDRNGNAGPTVWVDGRVVGGWAQRSDGEIVYELLESVPADARQAIDRRVGDLRAWMGDLSITPRFRSPHDKELSP